MDEASRDRQAMASPTAGAASHPQPIAPGPSNPGPAAGAGSAANQQLSKRRRGLGVVTPNACTECRKKRAKCDGQKPCGRCKGQKDIECVYEVPVRQSKENLRSEIEILRQQKRNSDQVLAALIRPELWEEVLQRLRSGQPLESISEWLGGAAGASVLAGFSRDAGLAGFTGVGPGSIGGMNLGRTASPVASQPQRGLGDVDQNSPWQFSSHSHSERSSSHPDLMSWTAGGVRGPPQSRVGSWVDSMNPEQSPESGGPSRYRGLDQVLAPLESPEMDVPAGTWTGITADNSLVQHLLALYFCWEYPTFASLSKEHFLRDFQVGRHRYCSPILVNALLALGCRFSTQPSTRANPNDPYTSGDHFFKEALRLFYLEDDHHHLTTIQALGIMSIREASCGRDSESWYYAGQSIRLAIEMGLHNIHDEGDEDELAVQAATFWGAFALDHAWSLATGSLPQCSCFPHLPPKPAIIDDIEASLWIPYTDDGAPLQRSCEQPSNVRSVYKCFCELSELVHQSLYILHSPGRPLTSRDLLSIYTQYLNWYDRIPEVLRLGHNFTPAVLFAHMYYHFAILLLFRPLIKLRIIGSSLSPRDVCSQAADAIQGLLRSYSQLYTLRRTPSFVPYFVLTSSIMHLAIGASGPPPSQGAAGSSSPASRIDPKVAEAIKQGIADLTEMAPCHGFAEQALNILRYLARKWHLDVDIAGGGGGGGGNGGTGGGGNGGGGGAIGNFASSLIGKQHDDLGLGRPLSSSLNFFAPNVREEDFMCIWGSGTSTTASTVSMATGHVAGAGGAAPALDSTMDNPLFWPFPMQGRPILPTGRALEEAGFALL